MPKMAPMDSILSSASLFFILAGLISPARAVSPGRLDKLSRAELLKLDYEVTDYYNQDYGQLDRLNITYDEYLFKSLRAVRHTSVLNQFDFRYTDDEIMRKSMGAQVNQELCRFQLDVLVNIAKRSAAAAAADAEVGESLPLSTINFLEANGQSASGLLNGNFFWLGSYSTCIRAEVSEVTVGEFSSAAKPSGRLASRFSGSIKGRYCVVHLRARSWPKWDIYFEDRLTIRKGLCMPESCHSALHANDSAIRAAVDLLARYDLRPPYNGARYETSHLYCLPDEDSPFRQLDLGAKLFVVFVALWTLLSIYANVKFSRRSAALRQLRRTVDIKMIVSERPRQWLSDEPGESGQQVASVESRGQAEEEEKDLEERLKASGPRGLQPPAWAASATSSANSTPMPSDLDEDSEFNVIKPFCVSRERKKSSNRSSPAGANYEYEASSKSSSFSSSTASIDFVKAFSLMSNLDYLFKSRSDNCSSPSGEQSNLKQKRLSYEQSPLMVRGSQKQPQRNSMPRRTSNELLIKDLHNSDSDQQHVAVVSGDSGAGELKAPAGGQGAPGPGQRVNIDLFDGVKVIATSYIVHGHTMMFFFGSVTDLRFGNERMLDLAMTLTINALQVVGLFYIITGCLLTYFVFAKAKPKQLTSAPFWLLIIVGRYFRLIPTYALVFWFARHVAPHTGQGVHWYDYRTDSEHARGVCASESWWTMWTMSAADVKIPLDCVPQAWYLSNDFRTLLVLPIYIILLAKSQRLGYAAILATWLYSTSRLTSVLREADIDYRVLLQWQPHVYSLMADRLIAIYTNFSIRISTYLLGAVMGHLLYLYQTRRIRQWPRWFRQLGLKFAIANGLLFFFGAQVIASPWLNQFLPSREQVDSDLIVLLVPLFKSAMEISMVVSLLLLATGAGFNWLRYLLASKPMKILSSISYAVFLTHVEVMYKMPMAQFESSYWYLFLYSTFFIVFSNILSLFICLLYEMPINNLLRATFKRAAGALGVPSS